MKLNKTTIRILSLIGVLIFLIIIALIYINSLSVAIEPNNDEVIFVEIPRGSITSDIASILKEKNLIKSEIYFEIRIKNLGYDSQLKAGAYELSKDMDVDLIIKKLVDGNNKIESVRFTIPEGYTIEQIADKLSEQGLVEKERFIQLAKEGNFDFEFLNDIPDDIDIKYKLEGYLFPETYEIRVGATEEEFIEKMLSQFEEEWKTEWDIVIEKNGLTMHQIVTLASIIEREVRVDDERPIVSGVFYNRLEDYWNLESCATVQYVLDKQKESLTYDDLEIDDPYNTYNNYGLPPGPIGNPGRSSLNAAVYPDDNQYYFFVTKKDDSGTHYFSKTYEEHLKYDAMSRGTW